MSKFRVPAVIKQFASHFTAAHFSLYIVGGAVRDYYVGKPSHDYDFATDAQPHEIIDLFHTVIPTGIAHGTVTVLFKGHQFEVTTFRVDGKYENGRRPESISFTPSLQEDVQRRDFTINALAVDATSGELFDYHGGKEDLTLGIIRAIGDPVQRFTEDALRILRACRLASQLNFSIEKETQRAMKLLSERLSLISFERIRDELVKILSSDLPSTAFLCMRDNQILDYILPELANTQEVEQKGIHLHDVFYHSLYSCDAAPKKKPLVRLAALLHDIGKVEAKNVSPDGNITFYHHEHYSASMAKSILRRLKFSSSDTAYVVNLITHHMFNYSEQWSDGAIRRFVQRVGIDALEDLFALRIADQIGICGKSNTTMIDHLSKRIQSLIDQGLSLSYKDLAVNGNDLLELGIPKGRAIGLVLQELLETVLDDPTQNTSETLLAIAKAWYKERLDIT